MMNVKKILEQKSGPVWSVNYNDTVFEAIKIMDEKSVGALVVVDQEKMVGILSERDYARKVILKERSSKNTQVSEIMTKNIFYVTPEKSVNECMSIMTKHHIRHLPVMENGQLTGMISMGDVVKEIIADQQYTIESLENSLTWGESY